MKKLCGLVNGPKAEKWLPIEFEKSQIASPWGANCSSILLISMF